MEITNSEKGTIVKLRAYPKINLCLYVGKKGTDGFHQIISLFQRVKNDVFFDDIVICVSKSDINCIEVNGLEQVADSKNNTVFRAVQLYMDKICCTYNVRVDIDKKIPSLAGLGGGSSDAGSVLLGLNSVFKTLNSLELLEIAQTVGSDVPFFIYDCQTAIVEGRGEIVSPISCRNDLHYELIPTKSTKLGTEYAYSMLDGRVSIPKLPLKQDLIDMYNKPVKYWQFSNDFEMLYKNDTEKYAKDCRLTGSGPFRFLVNDNL